jgi:hypothetical protein
LAEHAFLDVFQAGGADNVGVGHGVGVVAAEDRDVFADAEHLGGTADLKHDAGAEAGGGVAGICAEDADGAGCGGAEAHEQLNGGGLAGAVGAEEGDDFTTAEGEREVIERGDAVGVAPGDGGERGDGVGRGGRGKGGLDFEDCAHVAGSVTND